MSDKIIIKNMKIYGFHGVLEEEKKLGQNYFIDVIITKSLKKACLSDNLNDSIDYSKIYYDIVDLSNVNKFNLIEAFAENICTLIIEKYVVKKIEVTIKKPNAPINGNFEYVAINITRENSNEI
ncbi:MAG: dihydroneopterin aldolase [Fusobacteria bacterium]|nr:dihydroneopterin aldolase [Fusobacteriota bacterium]